MVRINRLANGAAAKIARYCAVVLMPIADSPTPWCSSTSANIGKVSPWMRAVAASAAVIAIRPRRRAAGDRGDALKVAQPKRNQWFEMR